jgi:preprotein translocase subunit SecG
MHWGTAFVIFLHVLFSIGVIVLVLAHSGRDSGLGTIGGASGGGGQHVMERNLDRLTVIVAALFVLSTFALHGVYS